jgi:hypothetical protein
MRVSLAVHKRQNQAREQGKAEKDDRNDLNRFFVAAFYQNINQKDTIQTGHNKEEKTERPAMKNVCVVDAEHGVYKDGAEVNERKDNRGDENKRAKSLDQGIDNLCNDKWRRAVSNRHQNEPQRPVRAEIAQLELQIYDDRKKKDLPDQNIHALNGLSV